MSKLLYVTDSFMDGYKTDFRTKYLPLYLKEDKEEINKIFSDPMNIQESSIEFDFVDLVLESKDPDANKKNMKIIWNSLKHLSISEASNEKIWLALENTYYLDYHLDQLSLITGKKRNKHYLKNNFYAR